METRKKYSLKIIFWSVKTLNFYLLTRAKSLLKEPLKTSNINKKMQAKLLKTHA